ncbi:MAG: class I SAM-dependent methyltransferase [Candidatus Hinthialibacter sp.]
MSLYDWVKRRDGSIADQSAGTADYFSLSPTRWSLYQALSPRMPTVLRGRCLDAGAGRSAFAMMAESYVDEYIAMDVQIRPWLDAAGSVLDLPLRSESLDSILCLQVLEHVTDPQRALYEFARCLKPGGALLLSVPHLAYLHNEPHDYFRYTKHGLRVLLEKADFEIVEIAPAGGLLSFLGHIPSMLVKAISYPFGGLKRAAFYLNAKYAKTVAWIDAHIEKRKLFALNYVVIAKKPVYNSPARERRHGFVESDPK